MATKRGWCTNCRKRVLSVNSEPGAMDYQAHGCLALLTCGIWLIPAFVWLWRRKMTYRCPKCGGVTYEIDDDA